MEENRQIWNEIVKYFNENFGSEEFKIQGLWENIFKEQFGYKSLKGEITSHKEIIIGATKKIITDIVLRKDNEDRVVVELKREMLDACDKKNLAQLLSYLKQLKISIGILIANKINLIVYDYNKDDKDQQSIQIEFVKDNQLGEKFVDLFRKENLDKDKIEEFVNENCKIKDEKQKLEKFIKDEEYIKSILANYFKENGYSQHIIDLLFNDYIINIAHKTVQITPIVKTFPEPIKHHDSMKDTKKVLKKDKAIGLCYKHNIPLSEYVTFASYNGKKYPANINIDYLNHEWFILLNNKKEKKLHVLKIPANTFNQNDFYIRYDKNLIVLEIDDNFIDYHPQHGKENDFMQYKKNTIEYNEEAL